MGRHKKVNAIKKGELKKGWQRFSFIAHEQVVVKFKLLAKRKKVSIKDLMDKVLSGYIEKENDSKINRNPFKVEDVIAKTKNEDLLKAFFLKNEQSDL